MHGDSQPTSGELLQAIVALHAFTEAGLQRLDSKIDRLEGKVEGLDGRVGGLDGRVGGLEGKVERLRFDMNKRFDHVYGELDEIKSRVTRLEFRPT